MLKSGDRSRSRDVSRPIFDGLGLGLEASGLGLGLEGSGLGFGLGLEGCGLGLGLGLKGCGLGLDVSGLGLKEHCWPCCRKCKHF